MFHQILPNPFVITTPGLTSTESYEVELVAALDVSTYKTAGLALRVHAGAESLDVTLRAYPVWPFRDAVGVRFQVPTAAVSSDTAAGANANGGLFVTPTPATICCPALRITLELLANGGSVAAGTNITISGGIVLLQS
jgi:hypothetical protein